MTDEAMAKRLRQKDMGVFDDIMAAYNKLLWVVVGSILENAGTPEDIEDCISDIYMKLLNNPKSYDPAKGSLKSFLVQMGKNQAIDRYRKLKRSQALPLQDNTADTGDDLLGDLLAKQNREKIIEALDRLKEPNREIMVRRYFYNQKVKVIAENMGLQPKEIENKLYQSKLKLKTFLASQEVI